MKHILPIALALLTAGAVSAENNWPENLVNDGIFANGLTSWINTTTNGGTTNVVTDTDGTFYLEVISVGSTTAGDAKYNMVCQPITLEAGRPYCFFAEYKATGSSQSGTGIGFGKFDTNTQDYVFDPTEVNAGTMGAFAPVDDWTLISQNIQDLADSRCIAVFSQHGNTTHARNLYVVESPVVGIVSGGEDNPTELYAADEITSITVDKTGYDVYYSFTPAAQAKPGMRTAGTAITNKKYEGETITLDGPGTLTITPSFNNQKYAVAPTTYTVNDIYTGVRNISEEVASSPKEYFSLTGERIQPNELSKGIYIVKQGNKVTKVIR